MITRQFATFAVIGVSLNAASYAAYLLLTHTVLGHLEAMTVSYCLGVVAGFALNRRFTFGFEGDKSVAFARYVAAYLIGYFLDLAALWLLADRLGVPHELAQGGLVLSIAVLLFILQRYWVFSTPSGKAYGAPALQEDA